MVIRRWNPAQHPRDRRGRFISVGMRIKAGGRGGIVVDYDEPRGGSSIISVKLDGTGIVRQIASDRVEVDMPPAGMARDRNGVLVRTRSSVIVTSDDGEEDAIITGVNANTVLVRYPSGESAEVETEDITSSSSRDAPVRADDDDDETAAAPTPNAYARIEQLEPFMTPEARRTYITSERNRVRLTEQLSRAAAANRGNTLSRREQTIRAQLQEITQQQQAIRQGAADRAAAEAAPANASAADDAVADAPSKFLTSRNGQTVAVGQYVRLPAGQEGTITEISPPSTDGRVLVTVARADGAGSYLRDPRMLRVMPTPAGVSAPPAPAPPPTPVASGVADRAPGQGPSLATLYDDYRADKAKVVEQFEDMYNRISGMGARGARVRIDDFIVTSDGMAVLKGNVTNAAGGSIGQITRTLKKVRGKYVLENDFLSINSSEQGNGIARDLYKRQEEWAKAEGVDRVEVHANIDVGGYAWAGKGFDFKTAAAAREYAESLKRRISNNSYLTAEERASAQAQVQALIDRPSPPTPYELSQVGRTSTSGDMWPGKAAMMGSHWYGVRRLQRGRNPDTTAAPTTTDAERFGASGMMPPGTRVERVDGEPGGAVISADENDIVVYMRDDGSRRIVRATDLRIVGADAPAPVVPDAPIVETPAAPTSAPVAAGDRIAVNGRTGIVDRLRTTDGIVFYRDEDGRMRTARAERVTRITGEGEATTPQPSQPAAPAPATERDIDGQLTDPFEIEVANTFMRRNGRMPGPMMTDEIQLDEIREELRRAAAPAPSADAAPSGPVAGDGQPLAVGQRIAVNGRTGTVTSVREGTGIIIYTDDDGRRGRSAAFGRVQHVEA